MRRLDIQITGCISPPTLSPGGKRVKGIEPSSSAWKAVALPLSYTRDGNPPDGRSAPPDKWGVQDSNLRRHCHQIYSLTPLTARETPLADPGFPPTRGDAARTLSLQAVAGELILSCFVPRLLQLSTAQPCFVQPRLPRQSQRRDSNPQPADYKSAALPIELRWPSRPVVETG